MSSAFFGRKGFSFFDCFYGVTWWCGFLTGTVRGLGFLGGGLSDLFFSHILREGKRQDFSKRFGGVAVGRVGFAGRRRAEAGSVPTATLHYIRSGGPGVSFLSFFFAFFSFSLSLLSLFSWLGVHMCTYVCTTGFRFPHNFFFLFRPFVFLGGGALFFFSCGARKSVSSCLILGLALFIFYFLLLSVFGSARVVYPESCFF